MLPCESQTLWVWWDEFLALGLAALNIVSVQLVLGKTKPCRADSSRDWNLSRRTSHCPAAKLLAAKRSPDPSA